ncbi:MAG: hypothetical protein KAJ51_00750 [Thermoplasmata archaeon]|nr:hypothetical protein [Thermoplasmata archaeon]
MRRKAILCAIAAAVVLLMILSVIPTTVGSSGGGSARGDVFEIGTDKQELPPAKCGLFLPFMKHQLPGYPNGGRGMFLYNQQLLLSYGMDSDGDLTRISFMNMMGGRIYTHPDAGSQFVQGSCSILNFRIKMGLTLRTTIGSTSYSSFYDIAGPTTVYYRPGWLPINAKHMTWMDFTLDTPFYWDSTSSLVIEYEWDDVSGQSLGWAHGGSWTGGYNNIKGNVMVGTFMGLGYNTILWSPYDKASSGFIYQPPNDNLPVLQIEGNFGILATVDVDPDTLNLDSMGNWVTLRVLDFPENPEYEPSQVIDGTVILDNIGSDANGPSGPEDEYYMCKVDRLALEDAIGAPGDSIELEAEGDVADTSFKGTCEIRAIHGP